MKIMQWEITNANTIKFYWRYNFIVKREKQFEGKCSKINTSMYLEEYVLFTFIKLYYLMGKITKLVELWGFLQHEEEKSYIIIYVNDNNIS